jgi:hypothetical protein
MTIVKIAVALSQIVRLSSWLKSGNRTIRISQSRDGGQGHMARGGAFEIGFVWVRPEGACRQRRRVPPRELSIDLVADERLGRATGRAEAS